MYEIVQGLLDIQHLTEKNLYNQRQKLHCEHQGTCLPVSSRSLYGIVVDFFLLLFLLALKLGLVRKHKEALQTCKSHNLALLQTNQQTELEVSCFYDLQ